MVLQVTPGSRLKDLVERRGIKMKEFAELSGIYHTTLSRYMNDKQQMPDKYIIKAAELLNVTPEYLKCESDDATPPEYQRYTIDESQEMLDYNRQQFRFSHMADFLGTLGVDFIWKLQIEDVVFVLDNHGTWHPVDGKAEPWMEEYGLDQIEDIKQIYKHPGKCKVWIEMTFKDKKVSLEYTEYQKWMRSLVATMELEVQKKFDLFYSISMAVADTDINRALRGEERLKWNDKDDYDVYEQHPKTFSGKPSEEEKQLEQVLENRNNGEEDPKNGILQEYWKIGYLVVRGKLLNLIFYFRFSNLCQIPHSSGIVISC